MARKRKVKEDEDRPVFDRGGYADRYSVETDFDDFDPVDFVRKKRGRNDDEEWN